MSIRKAVQVLGEVQEAAALEDGLEALGLGPAEANLVQLFRVLHRSGSMPTSLQHMTVRHLSEGTRHRLVDGFRRLEVMARAAQERLEAPVEPVSPKQREKPRARVGTPRGSRLDTGSEPGKQGRKTSARV